MKPTDLVNKSPASVPECATRSEGSSITYIKKYGYKSGFDGLNIEKSIELLSILSSDEEVANRIRENQTDIAIGFTNTYTDGSLKSFELIVDELNSAFPEIDLNVSDAVYWKLQSTKDQAELLNTCEKLLEEAGPNTASISNHILSYVSSVKILNREGKQEVIEEVVDNIYDTSVSYYSFDSNEELKNLGIEDSEHKARYFEKCLAEGPNNPLDVFAKFCFYRAQSIVERERHKDLRSPREIHLRMANKLIQVCREEFKHKIRLEKYLELYYYQIPAILKNINSELVESGLEYFRAARVAYEFHEGRELKLYAKGFKEVAKSYSSDTERMRFYENAEFFFENFELKSGEKNEAIRERIERQFKLEKCILSSKRIHSEWLDMADDVRKEAGQARSLINGDEKFMNQDPSILDDIIEDLNQLE